MLPILCLECFVWRCPSWQSTERCYRAAEPSTDCVLCPLACHTWGKGGGECCTRSTALSCSMLFVLLLHQLGCLSYWKACCNRVGSLKLLLFHQCTCFPCFSRTECGSSSRCAEATSRRFSWRARSAESGSSTSDTRCVLRPAFLRFALSNPQLLPTETRPSKNNPRIFVCAQVRRLCSFVVQPVNESARPNLFHDLQVSRSEIVCKSNLFR